MYLWHKGLFPCLGVLSRTRSQPTLQSTPHKWWNPLQRGGTTHRLTGLVPMDPSEPWRAGLAAHNPHHITLFRTKSKTAFRTACAKDKNSTSFRTCFSFLVHTLYITQSFHFLSPSVLASLSGHYSCSWASISCVHLPASPLQTLTWKHQYTVKTRPAALTDCWNTQAFYKLVVAGLWGGRHTLSPQ